MHIFEAIFVDQEQEEREVVFLRNATPLSVSKCLWKYVLLYSYVCPCDSN